ncbi:ATP-binding protein [Kaistia dalseonensis]|uniref:histidine kinase n=1 Tax=Kaistia dalseonensis TaxID=410840 RepID=A0ABU0HDL3_9HYPH|nr:ATP-binding protein [Kaistia dalseonensis]MCX5497398.1 ATP-binding protein [Kaistia dalseonensis]MDQ0440037.1 signal transduction histidine kinase [Kaistia dalseonensis]
MKSLRIRVALLIVGAIVAVVGLATVVAIGVIGRPGPERILSDAALRINLVARLVENNPKNFDDGPNDDNNDGIMLVPQPAGGLEDVRLTEAMRTILAGTGNERDVIITQALHRGAPPNVSLPIPGHGWIVMPLSGSQPPPKNGWGVLFGWMMAIIFGTGVIAVVIANRLIRPLQLLEAAIASIGPDGVLPPLPETGSGEIKATAMALNRLSARLKTAMESRMRLVAAAGHDLRTPMTRMRLRAEFLEDEEERALWLKDLEELDRIADSAIRLVREEVEATELQDVNLDGLLPSLIDELSAQRYAVRLGSTVPACVRVSPLALTRALRNVLINSATHGGGGVAAVRVEDDFAVIAISDSGPGIPEALLERVFEPFFRVDPARRQSVPGAGLGLAITKEIVERSGGRISVRNAKEGGLIQEIWLPLAVPATA